MWQVIYWVKVGVGRRRSKLSSTGRPIPRSQLWRLHHMTHTLLLSVPPDKRVRISVEICTFTNLWDPNDFWLIWLHSILWASPSLPMFIFQYDQESLMVNPILIWKQGEVVVLVLWVKEKSSFEYYRLEYYSNRRSYYFGYWSCLRSTGTLHVWQVVMSDKILKSVLVILDRWVTQKFW